MSVGTPATRIVLGTQVHTHFITLAVQARFAQISHLLLQDEKVSISHSA